MSLFQAAQQHDVQDAINRLIGLTSSKKRHYAAMKRAVRELESTTIDLRGYASALKVAETRYRAMFEYSDTCVAVFEAIDDGEDFIFKEFNRAAEVAERKSRNKLLGQKVSQALPSLADFGVAAALRRVYRTDAPEHFPTTYYQDGSVAGWREGYVYKLPTAEVVFIYQDVTERQRAEETLHTRERYLECLATIATEALQHDDLDRLIPSILAHLGNAAGVERAFLFENHRSSDGHLQTDLRFEWAGDDMPPLLDNPRSQNVDFEQRKLSHWTKMLANRQHVAVNANELMPHERQVMQALGVHNILAIPLFVLGEWDGLIGFGCSAADREWTTQEITLLEAAASTIAQTIERRQTQQALRLTQFSMDHATDAMFWVRRDGAILDMNDAARRRLGYPPNKLDDVNLLDFSPTHTSEMHRANWERLREEGSIAFNDVHRGANGHLFPVEVTASYLHFENREYGFFVARDITDRQQTEAALHASEMRLQYLTGQVRIAVWSADRDLHITYHSGALSDDVGSLLASMPREELTVGDLLDCVYDPDTAAMRMEQLQQVLTGKITRYEHHAGDQYFENIVSPLRDDDDEIIGLVGLALDATERRRLEDRANQSQRLEALGKLAGGIAHDFNNLLTGIIGNLSLAELDASPDIMPMLTDADKAARRATGLTRQLLAFARRSPATMKSVNLNEVVRDATSLIRETIDRRIDIVVDLQTELAQIRGDDTQLSQVVMNLLVNARDAIAECLTGLSCPSRRNDPFVIAVTTQEVVIDPSEAMIDGSVRPGRHVLLSVSDNGVGMSGETREHIFEPFFTTKPAGKGTGLGLSTVHGILRQHDGWINVYSEPGRGTTFRVYLPPFQESTTTEVEESSTLPIAGGSETILVADDEDLVLTLGQRILEGYGYTVLTASDGHKALNTFMEHADDIDLVVLDLSMPILSGREVMDQLQALDPKTRIIIASGYSSDNEIDELVAGGARAYIQKPYHISDLVGTVRAILDAE